MATTPQTNATLAEITEVIRANDDFVICGHISPDGDCLGSQLTLWHTLKELGKRATCVLVKDDPVSADLAFMPGIDEMIPAERFDGICKTFIGLDVPSRERIGEPAARILDQADVSITVDHHAADVAMCQHVYVDPDSASASILVWEIVKLLVERPPIESALCAYVGLMTDTGGFCFQNSDEHAFKAAAELVSFGVDPAKVATCVYQNRSLESLKLEALALDRLEVLCNGKAAISWITEEDMKLVGAVKSDAELLIDAVRSLRGTRVACFLREQDGMVRGNLRAKDDTDVSVLARELGGGGHKAASGFTVKMDMQSAVGLMREKLSELLR